jgi:hypothetical protein
MVNSVEELEAQLIRLDRGFERVDEATVLVRLAPNQPPAALRISGPVLLAQVEICSVPAKDKQREFYEKLLTLNGSDLFHAAYAISDGGVVLGAALELASLDPNELEATLADFDVALAKHIGPLHEMIS